LKIARDITERKQAAEQKDLFLREMNHRVKNLFALASGLVALSARSPGTQTPQEMATALQARLAARARAPTSLPFPTSRRAVKAWSQRAPTDTVLNCVDCGSFCGSAATIAIALTIASTVTYQRSRGRSVTPRRHWMLIGRLNHRHDHRRDPLLQAPHDQHFQGRQATEPAQATQERQLLLNMRVRPGWPHATETPRNRCGCVRFRTWSANPRRGRPRLGSQRQRTSEA
jgi:hypothetical protein